MKAKIAGFEAEKSVLNAVMKECHTLMGEKENELDIEKDNGVKLEISEKTNRELAAQVDKMTQKTKYLELEVEETRSDSQLHYQCLHAIISVSLGDDLAKMQGATEKKNRFLSKVLTKVTASRNECCEIFMKLNEMMIAAGLGHVDFGSIMGPAESIEGSAEFIDFQTGKRRAMSEDWAKIGENLRKSFTTGKELVRLCFEEKLVVTTVEMSTQTDKKPNTPRESKEKKRALRRKQWKMMNKN